MKTFLLSLTAVLALSVSPLHAKPLKVYILSGQSNMQGHARVSTFDHIGMDPKTAPLLKKMRGDDDQPVVCKNVWISSISAGGNDEKHGQLTAGFGAADDKIGPEFTFGITMQELVQEPILIIKTAWGGKSLNTDFRPPSAGPYEFNESQLEQMKKQGKDIEQAKKERAEASGHYYRLMMEHVKKVLADIKRVYPDYNSEEGYEIAGFVWFQGWNDMVDGSTYPDRYQPGGYDLYSTLMAQFIRDVRKELNAPGMPFVIGVAGVGGPTKDYDSPRYQGVHQYFRDAMAAPASLPEFKGNVTAVLTENFWDHQLDEIKNRGGKIKEKSKELEKDSSLSKEERKKILDEFKANLYSEDDKKILTGSSNQGFHYNGSGKIFAQIGEAFANAVYGMMK
jgi:alpha-galactosidase